MLKHWNKFKKSVERKFLAGIFASIPIILTVYFLKMFLSFFNNIVGPLLTPLQEKYLGYIVPGLGVVAGIFLIYLLGILTTNLLGKSIFRYFENLLDRIPIIRTVYNTSKKILDAFQFSSTGFEKVVFFEFPRKGIWTMGFVTGNTLGKDGTKFYSIFVPTTPNPTSGWMIFLPETDIVPSNLPVEEGLQTLISAGTIIPDQMNIYKTK